MRIAVLDDYQGVAREMGDWASLGPDCEVVFFRDHLAELDPLVQRLKNYDVVVAMRERTPFPRALLERLPRLRLLVTTGLRNASIDLTAARERGVVVCGTPGASGTTGELTWGLILALFRQIPREDRSLREGKWQTTVGLGLAGKTLGIIGLGTIGSQVAKVGAAFNMEVIAWSQNLDAERASRAGAKRVERDELLARSDVVTIHLVLSERTRGLVRGEDLALMKPGAILVNTSRGPIVVEKDLLHALQAQKLHAALDVYEREPLAADHPLRKLDNVTLSPHLGYVHEDNYRIFYRDTVDNVAAFMAGKPVRVINE